MRPQIPLDWLDVIPVPIFILDRTGKVWHVNPSFSRLVRIRKNALIGKRIDTLLKREDNHKLLKDVLDLYRGNAIVRGAYRVSLGSLKTTNIVLDLTPIQHPTQNRVEYVFGMVHGPESQKQRSLVEKLLWR
jgi:PAS domain S-box-containing protein